MSNVHVTQKASVAEEIAEIEQAVARRAYELFEERGASPGDAWADWFTAERELLPRPAIVVREERGAYVVSASVPDDAPDDVAVEVAPQDLVIRDRSAHLFGSVHLPTPIDVDRVHATVKHGMLTVRAPLVSAPRPA